MEALRKLKLIARPFPDPALLTEGNSQHMIDAWCYRDAARTEDEVWSLLENGRPCFDRAPYRILVKHVGRMAGRR